MKKTATGGIKKAVKYKAMSKLLEGTVLAIDAVFEVDGAKGDLRLYFSGDFAEVSRSDEGG